jgi:hypothetical protein
VDPFLPSRQKKLRRGNVLLAWESKRKAGGMISAGFRDQQKRTI